MILDFHTHLGEIFPAQRQRSLHESTPPPPELMISSEAIEDSSRLFYRKRPPLFSFGFLKHAALTLLRRPRVLRGMTIPNLLRDMQTHHIDLSVVLPIEYADGCDRSARLIAACRQTNALILFCSIHPKDVRWREKLDTYLRSGAQGLKLHPNFQRIRMNSREVGEICEAFAPHHLPLMIHSGITGREPQTQRYADLREFWPILQRFPDMPVVLAHAGITQYDLAIQLARRHEQVFLEISGQPAQHLRQALDALGAERLLFGSDWPFWHQRHALQAAREAAHGDAAIEQAILFANAARLLQLRTTQQTMKGDNHDNRNVHFYESPII